MYIIYPPALDCQHIILQNTSCNGTGLYNGRAMLFAVVSFVSEFIVKNFRTSKLITGISLFPWARPINIITIIITIILVQSISTIRVITTSMA